MIVGAQCKSCTTLMKNIKIIWNLKKDSLDIILASLSILSKKSLRKKPKPAHESHF